MLKQSIRLILFFFIFSPNFCFFQYITEKKYPASLLELFPTSEAESFKGSVEKLLKAFPAIMGGDVSGMTVSTGQHHGDPLGSNTDALIAAAFTRKG